MSLNALGDQSRLIKLMLVCLLLLLNIAASPVEQADDERPLSADLSYQTETTWRLPGLPHLSAAAGTIPHNFSQGEEIFQFDSEVIHGFRPGKAYKEMYIRDIAWGMETAQYYYGDEYLREPIEAYLRRQYTAETRSLDGDFGILAGEGAIGGIITPDGESNKQTITTDEETSLIHAAYLYYTMAHNTAWLESTINDLTIIERLNLAADWLYDHRFDQELQLLWRGHTTDWGDVKFEKDLPYTDYNPDQDHQTASIYDQAMAYMALRELAQMNAVVGKTDRAVEWQTKAEALKKQTNVLLWQTDRFYLTHAHITPLEHPFDEAAMVSISNALAVYAGLTDFEQNTTIFQHLERVRLAARANKPGLSIYPYYPNRWPNLFFDYLGMGYGNYQNGGVWDWWGGVQIKAEFQNGFAEAGRTHLLQVVNEWQTHPGNIIEWHSTTDPRHEGSHYYSAAAGTMGSAIIEGFFGLTLDGQGLTMQPRLDLYDGFIRVYQPATDRYAAYQYDWDQNITRIDYGTNVTEPVTVKVLKRRTENVQAVAVDGKPVEFRLEILGYDTYVAFNAPPGQHSLEIIKGEPTVQPPPVASTPTSPGGEVVQGESPTLIQPDLTAKQKQLVSTSSSAVNRIVADVVTSTGVISHPAIEAGPILGTSASLKGSAIDVWLLDRLDLLQFIFTMLVVFPALALMILLGLGYGKK
jgi:hypothetical protein